MDPFMMFLAAIAGGGKLYEGFAGSRIAGIQGAIARDNAALMRLQAAGAREDASFSYDRGAFDQARLRRQIGGIVGAQTANFAANHLDPSFGAPVLLAARTIVQGETDAELIGANAAVEAARHMARAAGFEGNAATAQWQVAAAKDKEFSSIVAGVLGAATAMLSVGGKGFKPSPGGNDLGPVDLGTAGQPWQLNFRSGT